MKKSLLLATVIASFTFAADASATAQCSAGETIVNGACHVNQVLACRDKLGKNSVYSNGECTCRRNFEVNKEGVCEDPREVDRSFLFLNGREVKITAYANMRVYRPEHERRLFRGEDRKYYSREVGSHRQYQLTDEDVRRGDHINVADLHTGRPQSGTRPEGIMISRVLNGDTFDVHYLADGSDKRVQLLGVEAPAYRLANVEDECYGKTASINLKTILRRKYVALTADPEVETGQRPDTYPYYVEFNGEDLAASLLSSGMVSVTDDYYFTRYDEYRLLEDQAKAAGVGMWGQCDAS